MRKPELELIIETVPDAVVVIDNDGRIIYANRAAEIMLGISRNELRTRTYSASSWKITTPDGRPIPTEDLPISRVIKDKEPVYGEELAIEQPGGKRIILSINAVPILDKQVNIEHVIASLANITKQKLADLALKESEQRFRELLKGINLAAVILDTNGRVKFANDYILELVDLDWESVKDKDFFNIFVSEEQKSEAKKLFFDSISKGTIEKKFELNIETLEGDIHTISFNNVVIRDALGNITGIAGIGEDVTEQHRTAEEIKESRRQVLDILESITDAFYALDNDWRFTYVNHRTEELIGINRVNLLFRDIWQVLPKEEFPRLYEEYHRAKKQMKPIVFDDFIPRLNRWLEMHVYPYQNGLSIYIRDVTDLKHAEQERIANLHFFESMDRVNRSILTAENLEEMMSNTLGCVLDIFDSDRAWLVYPCDPETSSWRVPMERTKPEYPGALAMGVDVPIDPQVVDLFKVLLATNEPVGFGPGSEYPTPSGIAQRFEFKSQLTMAIYPKVGKPWVFGVHQCSYPRVWKQDERRLFKEIGWRITDGLSSLLIYRELEESEKKYHQIVDTANEGIWVLGPDAKTTLINNRMAEMIGYSSNEVIGRPMSDFMFKEDVPDHLKRIEDRRRGISETYERRFRRKDGETIWVLVSATPIFDNEKHFNGSFSMLTDITDRKRAEDSLRRQLGENLAMFNQAVTTFALIGLDYRFIQVNKTFASYYGKKPEDIVGDSMINYRSATQSPEDIKELINRVVQTKKAINYLNRAFVLRGKPERAVTYWDWTLQPIFDKNGEVEFVFFLGVDVTKRKRAEDELRKSEQKYRELFEDSLDGIFITSPAGEIIDASKKAINIFGYDTKDEVLHLNLARDIYVNPEDRGRVLEKIDKQGYGEFDIVMKRKNGKKFIAHTLVAAVRDENGVITSYRGIIRDVSEHKRVEII